MSDKSKIKKNQNNNENKSKKKTNPIKKHAKDERIRQNEGHIQKSVMPTTTYPKTSKEPDSDTATQIDKNNPFPNREETDNILKIVGNPNYKYAKREMKSNWPEFELPPEDYETMEETSQGADFKALAQTPISLGAHFQFKHEKTWAPRKKSTENTELFRVLDAELISDALSCIPFYDRNKLDPTLFSEEQITKMKKIASKNKANFYKNLQIASLEYEKLSSSTNKVASKSEMETSELRSFKQKSQQTNKSNVPVIKDTLSAKLENIVLNDDDDDELDTLLETALESANSNISLSPTSSKGGKTNVTIKVTQMPVLIPDDVDLDKWLDDFVKN